MTRALVVLLIATGVAFAAPDPTPPAPSPTPLYDRFCLACHGETGDGRGPAAPFLYPKPRDLTKAMYRFRSTPSGQPPTDEDLARILREGLPGTSMPGFEGILDERQIGELVATVKAFAPRRFGKPGLPIKVPAVPADLATRRDRGAELFGKAGCAVCHGAGGKGDGAGAAGLKDETGRPLSPRDLTGEPLKRHARGPADLYLTIATGLDGANMPGFVDALPEADLWALVAFVDSIRWQGTWKPGAGKLDPRGKEAWRPGLELPAQGDPPPSLPPAAASLSSLQCARCHAEQARQWRGSLHAATFSPGTYGQFVGASKAFVAGCQRCHAPLAEQRPGEPAYDARLRQEGATCAGCHLRGWTRHGPPPRPGLLANPAYPAVVDAAYERSDFCLPCHQLAPGDAVEGRPLLDTYREWLEGPYMRRGVQCQHCHMPGREHSWKGVHDRATVEQGLDVRLVADRRSVMIIATNVGAGHYLPTTSTPALWLDVELLDGKNVVLARASKRIGRDMRYDGGWKQVEDTRIPPGESLRFAPVFAELGRASAVQVQLRVHPDDYYEGFYRRLLKRKLAPEARAAIEEALQRTLKSRFVALTRRQKL